LKTTVGIVPREVDAQLVCSLWSRLPVGWVGLAWWIWYSSHLTDEPCALLEPVFKRAGQNAVRAAPA